MRSLLLALALLPAPVAALVAQAPPPAAEAEVMRVVGQLFDGMRAGDSTAVRAAFHPQATLMSVGVRDDVPVLQTGTTVDAFVRAVGTPHDQVWDERIWNPEVRVDGNLATAWMDYAFYLGDRLSHCGVNAFQLFRGPDGWRVIHIADTRRREGCSPPPA